MCSSRKNPHTLHGRSLEIPEGRGVLIFKILEAKYKAKPEFPGGMGMQNKKPSMRAGSMDIFCNYTMYMHGVVRKSCPKFSYL